MNIEEKLRNMKPKDTPLLWLGYTILGMMLLLGQPANAQSATDNVVNISNPSSSDYLDLNIQQAGYSQKVNFSIGGANNTVNILQDGNNMYIGYTDVWGSGYTWGGDLAGTGNELTVKQKCSESACNDNDFQFHITGNYNQVIFGQGYELNDSLSPTWSYDGSEPGGNFVQLDIHGNYNDFVGSQKQDTSAITHSMTVNLYGDYNEVFAKQQQNGNKTLNLTVNNNYNDLWIHQKNTGAHSATINLSGSYGTSLNLLQQGSTNQTYTLTQDCQTAGGCSVSVTQGQ